MLKIYFLCMAAMLPFAFLGAQSPVFSQFYTHRPSLNPAYVSALRGIEFTAGYRRQWGQVQNGLQTAFAAASLRACRLPLGVGVYVSDVREPFFNYKQQEAGFQMGGFFGRPKRWSVHGALQAGIGQHRVDYSRLVFSGQLDPVFGVQGSTPFFSQQDGSRVQTFEIGAGGVLRTSLKIRRREMPFSIGAVIHHVGGSRDVSFLRLGEPRPQRITAHSALTVPVSSEYYAKSVLYVNVLGRMEWESKLQRSTLGAIMQYDAMHFGLLYQYNRLPFTNDNTHALTLCLGADFSLNNGASCTLQYGFDGILGGLGQAASGGAHELTATFHFDKACVLGAGGGGGTGGTGGGKSLRKRGKTDCFHFVGKGYRGFY